MHLNDKPIFNRVLQEHLRHSTLPDRVTGQMCNFYEGEAIPDRTLPGTTKIIMIAVPHGPEGTPAFAGASYHRYHLVKGRIVEQSVAEQYIGKTNQQWFLESLEKNPSVL